MLISEPEVPILVADSSYEPSAEEAAALAEQLALQAAHIAAGQAAIAEAAAASPSGPVLVAYDGVNEQAPCGEFAFWDVETGACQCIYGYEFQGEGCVEAAAEVEAAWAPAPAQAAEVMMGAHSIPEAQAMDMVYSAAVQAVEDAGVAEAESAAVEADAVEAVKYAAIQVPFEAEPLLPVQAVEAGDYVVIPEEGDYVVSAEGGDYLVVPEEGDDLSAIAEAQDGQVMLEAPIMVSNDAVEYAAPMMASEGNIY